ncbi:MAG: hypothetical protein ACYC6P_07355 [Ignavibacteriaceae bacterium]
MEIKKENIQISSYLVGFHSFRKDHNYGNYKANLINDIQSLLNLNFDTLKIGGLDLLKVALDDSFEIRLTPSNIIYQDKLTFEEIISNSKEILNIWLKYSPNVKLSLIGFVSNFDINLPKPVETNHFRLKNQYFRDFRLGKKLKGVDLRFNYLINQNGYDYNVLLSLIERDDQNYSIQGVIDFNASTENNINGLQKVDCDRVFNAAKNYFENDLFQFLNLTNE